MSVALVNPQLLRWTRERAGLDLAAMAERLAMPADRVAQWESGSEAPTFAQATKWATVTHQPFGYLYLPEPPNEVMTVPDLRVLDGRPGADSDPDFRALVQDIDFKAEWYTEYHREHGIGPFAFVSSLPSAGAKELAKAMRAVLKPAPNDARNAEEYMRQLVVRAEDAGIWVMRTSVVGHNTQRPIEVETCRGFAVADPITPRVFVNSKDAKPAQVFTLVHELAHIWLGRTGVDDPFAVNSRSAVERVCNEAAAEFLAPEADVRHFWAGDPAEDPVEHVRKVADRYRISRLAAALRLLNLGLIDRDTFSEVQAITRAAVSTKAPESKGQFYNLLRARNGGRFVDAVIGSTLSGRTTFRDAGALLRVKPKVIATLAEQAMEGRG